MTSSLLTLVQRVQSQLGLFTDLAISTVVGATDDTTMQMFALINDLGDELMTLRDWRTLEGEGVITPLPPVITTGTTVAYSPVVTGVADLTGVTANTWVMTGQYFAQYPRVVSVDSASQVTMNETASASGTITLTFSQDTYSVPADFRHFVNGTAWDRTRRWELLGPTSPQEDQWMRSGIAAIGPRRRYRQVGRGLTTFRLWPPPTATDTPATLVFDYISSYWATDASGNPKAQFTADTDTCVFPDNVMVAGLRYRWLEAKGFDAGPWRDKYMAARDIAMAQDGGARTVNMGRKRWPVLISGANIPDANFPSSP